MPLHPYDRQRHSGGKAPRPEKFVCEWPGCGYRTNRGSKIKRHIQRNHTKHGEAATYRVEDMFKCATCARMFANARILHAHVRQEHDDGTVQRHRNYGSFPCEICPQVCTEAGHLRTHVQRIHHMANPIKCAYCKPTSFKDIRGYMDHVRRVHPDKPVPT